ncbi:uncharacterized protein LOC129591736 [Paramacrobiotus metropolitanus]|uniref:uncharacterized protein LOC129591736 n=1 Tax=Paramacrobiotus metropolitanus TaxID=2943436 RepID=UPI00244562F9|nr:uncharacterized protein LOC129591736 [Paramacrobiotus metropolitanus]
MPASGFLKFSVMDSNKENLSHSTVSLNSSVPVSSFHHCSSLPEKLNLHSLDAQQSTLGMTSTSSNPILRSQDICIDDPPLTADEQLLAEAVPELAQLIGNLKIRSITASLDPELLDPLTDKLESHAKSYEKLRTDVDIEKFGEVIQRLEELKGEIEAELKPFLDVFGVGLPTEPWHIDAVKALVTEKLKSPTMTDKK